jgi:hypothetical protein
MLEIMSMNICNIKKMSRFMAVQNLVQEYKYMLSGEPEP